MPRRFGTLSLQVLLYGVGLPMLLSWASPG